jgi:hypothetical protein
MIQPGTESIPEIRKMAVARVCQWIPYLVVMMSSSLDWFCWENLQESPIFDGKNHGFL